jgi:WD40 repeat protein
MCRKHVFGMSATSYSGNTIYALPSTPTAFHRGGSAGGGGGGAPPAANRSNPNYIDGATVVYATAGLGVVHNLADNKQLFFDAHDDDITCIAVSADGAYAATGQMGKNPVVHIWQTDLPQGGNSRTVLNTIGTGFFARGVCALAFSWDNKYIVCIGCDDNHAMGVFDTSTCNLIVEMPCQHGIPPQIKWIDYCPGQQHTEYITKEHAGLCDLFATAGSADMTYFMWELLLLPRVSLRFFPSLLFLSGVVQYIVFV